MSEMIVSENFVFTDFDGDFKDVVASVSKKFMDNGIVKESYEKAILAREIEFPTGLEGMHGNFALPHTYCEHCNSSAIAIIRTSKPISFVRMDDHDSTIECQLIVMLAVADPKEQLPLLRKLMKAMQNAEVYRMLTCCKDEQQVADGLKAVLSPGS